MRYRCSNCTELYVVSESTSLYPQSFCGKTCEVESVVMNHDGESLLSMLSSLDDLEVMPEALVH